MRRLALFVALGSVTFLGFGAAYVLAGSTAVPRVRVHTGTNITLCHATSSPTNPFVEDTVDASSIVNPNTGDLEGHGLHTDDIIPPFTIILSDGITERPYDGQNMDTLYGAGYTGAEVLANGCDIPTGAITSTTTVTTTVPVATTITETVTGDTVTTPAVTVTTPVTVTVSDPANTVTAPGATTVVTVPAGQTTAQTTTVTVPARTVTLPASTDTTSTVETVTVPGHVIHIPPHIIHAVENHTVTRKVIEMLIRACQGVSGAGVGKG